LLLVRVRLIVGRLLRRVHCIGDLLMRRRPLQSVHAGRSPSKRYLMRLRRNLLASSCSIRAYLCTCSRAADAPAGLPVCPTARPPPPASQSVDGLCSCACD
jgi:hypothetical protein